MKRAKILVLFGFVLALGLASEVANADFIYGKPTNLGPNVNSAFEDAGQSISADGLTLYISSNRPGGTGDWDIWVTSRATLHDDWSVPQNLGPIVNTAYMDTSPCLSADGLSLFFGDGVWHNYNPRPGGFGKCDLWVSTRTARDSEWTTPLNLGPTVNTAAHECDPSLSADGLELYFDSDRIGGSGNVDLWVVSRVSTSSPWQNPVNLGPSVNSSAVDAFPWISFDGLRLFFMSDRTGDYDLYVTSRRSISEPWEPAINLGPGVNSVGGNIDETVDACPSLSVDGTILFFMSMRSPKIGGLRDLWQVSITPIIDFNGDKRVDLKDFSKLAQHWGQDESSVDIGPMPWGDYMIDVQDVAVFAEYWLFDSSLVAYWKLDETEGSIAYDIAGENNGSLNGGPVWQPTGGAINGALQLDGTNDYVSTPFVLNPSSGQFSAMAWVKGGSPGQVVLSQQSSFLFPQGKDWLCADAAGGKLITALTDGSPSTTPLVSEFVITDGEWHCIAVTWDGSRRRLYADGVKVAEDLNPLANLVSSDKGLYFGAGKTLTSSTFWSGLIDDVRIYNRAVSP